MASQPDVVGNGSEHIVLGFHVENGSKPILEVPTTAGLETDSVDVKSGTPERTVEEIDVPVNVAASVVAEADIDLGLNIGVDHAHDAVGRQE